MTDLTAAHDDTTQRDLIESLAPGHMTPQDFYDRCQSKAERTGADAYDVARSYALGVIFGDR